MFGFLRRKTDTRIQHPLADEFYGYIDGVRFDPGSPAEGFLPEFVNPLYTVRGGGRIAGWVAGQWMTHQPQQVFKPLAVPLNGIPTIAGQYILQPLIVGDEQGT